MYTTYILLKSPCSCWCRLFHSLRCIASFWHVYIAARLNVFLQFVRQVLLSVFLYVPLIKQINKKNLIVGKISNKITRMLFSFDFFRSARRASEWLPSRSTPSTWATSRKAKRRNQLCTSPRSPQTLQLDLDLLSAPTLTQTVKEEFPSWLTKIVKTGKISLRKGK